MSTLNRLKLAFILMFIVSSCGLAYIAKTSEKITLSKANWSCTKSYRNPVTGSTTCTQYNSK
jgi:hypothetical protein